MLVASWLVLLPLLWNAFSTLPTAERLEQSHMARIPTLQALGLIVARSAAELAAVLALTWPAARLFASRLALAALGLAVWFLYSMPLGLSRMEWLHRRWLALLVVLLLAGALVELAMRGVARARR